MSRKAWKPDRYPFCGCEFVQDGEPITKESAVQEGKPIARVKICAKHMEAAP